MTRATHFYAAAILKDPANWKLAQQMSTLADSERITQLCNAEGIEQIRRANPQYNPDMLVSYAVADPVMSGMTLSADGGAFHSGKSWYRVRFRCTVAADYSGVRAFEFALGKPIPASDWDSDNLPARFETDD
jgi:hypothetical protein